MAIVNMTHSHPNGSLIVSKGDVDVASLVQTQFPNAQFCIYNPYTQETKQYDGKSEIGLLPEIVVISNKHK